MDTQTLEVAELEPEPWWSDSTIYFYIINLH